MPDTVIRVEDLWKQYRLGTINHDTLRADLASWWARVRGTEDPNLRVDLVANNAEGQQKLPDRFWALRDISFEVKQGEVLGIIGKNGAGKSTLLKILSRVTTPTRGQIKVKGRIASLLEVGTGFHPELTGRENIFLNGAILGMNKTEIHRKMDEIIAFAEVEKFIDTPVKRYSSGMYVRLAFAVAAHLEPEILVVDEVLAVGDAEFQKKCLGKMGDVASQGRTVLFVSHNMGSITRLCERAIWMDAGDLQEDGEAGDTVANYLKSINVVSEDPASVRGHGLLSQVNLQDQNGHETRVVDYGSPLTVGIRFRKLPEREKYVLAVRITSADGTDLFTSWDRDYPLGTRPETGLATCRIPPNLLKPGGYMATVMLHDVSHHEVAMQEEIKVAFHVAEVGCSMNSGRVGVIAPLLEWRYGNHDAPG